MVGGYEGLLGERSCSKSIALIGMRLMAEMEELSEQFGKCWFKYRAREEDVGAVALVLGLAKAFERVSFLWSGAWTTHFSFPRKILRVLCGYFEHQRRV